MKDVLMFLERFYLSVTIDKILLKSHLQMKELSPLTEDVQIKILEHTVKNPCAKKYSPPLSYQKFFLRTLLDIVESNGSEVSDDLIESYASNLSLSSENTDYFYRTYIIKDCTITLQESSCFVVNSTTGLQTWEAAKYLLEWCLENASLLQNKRILELGSGIGLLGIAIIKLCQPQKYLFSDKSRDVLDILTKNIEINVEENVAKDIIEKHQLLWETVHLDDVIKLQPDFIFGADIVFDPSLIKKLVDTIRTFLNYTKTKCAYIASTIRNADTDEYFSTELYSAGLNFDILKFNNISIFFYCETSKFSLYKIYLKEN